MLVSIGPCHHGNPNLSAMEEHKLRYLRSYLRRVNSNNDIDTINVEQYLLWIEELADTARACYADPICLSPEKFVEMLLLDACFIIEFLCKYHFKERRDEGDPIFMSHWMTLQISQDLMLLENQLPFFVLSVLFVSPNSRTSLIELAALFPVSIMLPKYYSTNKTKELIREMSRVMETSVDESKHFLDLVYRLHLPTRKIKPDSGSNSTRMSRVMELQEAGIGFKVNESDDVSMFDIRFEHSRMTIPKIKVQDGTEIFLRNIVAYEQHSSVEPKYFTDYRSVMDSLINTEIDATELRLRGIIENMLGDDEEVARMFNKLGDGVIIDPQSFYYSIECQRVKEHCGKSWNRYKAKLRHNYFHNPWQVFQQLQLLCSFYSL